MKKLKIGLSYIAGQVLFMYETSKLGRSMEKANLRCYDHMPENPAPERDFIEQPLTPDFSRSTQEQMDYNMEQGTFSMKPAVPTEYHFENLFSNTRDRSEGMINGLPPQLTDSIDDVCIPEMHARHFSPSFHRGDATVPREYKLPEMHVTHLSPSAVRGDVTVSTEYKPQMTKPKSPE